MIARHATERWTAHCPDCPWTSPTVGDARTAGQALTRHRQEHPTT